MDVRGREIFSGLLGNSGLKETLAADLAAGKSAHAYIIDGPSGSGKHTIARLICQATLCENRNDDSLPLPCGECDVCRKISGGMSVDVMTVTNGDKASIGVEAIRELRQNLYIAPNDGDKKFYIIENAHLMTAQAQNALLLSLEEPPPYVMLLLLAEDSSALLETVRSRAPTIKIELFSPEFISEFLLGKKNLTKAQRDRVPAVSQLCGGSLGAAMTLLSGGEGELLLYKTAGRLTELLLTEKKSDTLAYIAANLPKEREGVREMLTLMRFALRDIVSSKRGGSLLFFTEAPAYIRKVSLKRVFALSDAVAQAEIDIAANCSSATVLTALTCKCG